MNPPTDEKTPADEPVPGEGPVDEPAPAGTHARSWVPLLFAAILIAVLATVLLTAWAMQAATT